MAIRVTLDRILLERRMSLTDLSEKVGVTLANLSILKTGKAKAIRFSTLTALCRVLDCQPGDLLAYEASADDIDAEAADQAAE
ncbi:MAG: helix-turn-helix transcriptional regulator [Hyphomonadaceae bacterium]|nr:helix-turn-helix transcriptional regulator [Hyphomonadaceae bacterium]